MVHCEPLDPLQRRLRLVTLSYLLIYPLPWLERPPTAEALAASALGVGVFLVAYCRVWGFSDARRLWYALPMLGVGLALSPFHGTWSVFVGYAGSTAGFVRPPRLALTGIAAVLAVTLLFGLARGLSPWEYGPGLFFATILGGGAIVLATIKARDDALARAREESRDLAVLAERERIARDLHDVLGHTLTLVAVKADLARRLIERDPGLAARELEEIHAASRAALSDVRAAVSGMRSTTLARELSAARSALASAGVRLEEHTTTEAFPPKLETALAYILREAATNVVRHAGARTCRISLSRRGREVELVVRDDGRGGPIVAGQGVSGMRSRIDAVAGVLEIDAAEGTSVCARAPLSGVEA